jgi:hypothetical protein
MTFLTGQQNPTHVQIWHQTLDDEGKIGVNPIKITISDINFIFFYRKKPSFYKSMHMQAVLKYKYEWGKKSGTWVYSNLRDYTVLKMIIIQ